MTNFIDTGDLLPLTTPTLIMAFLTRPEELILLAVWNLQDNAYGAAIRLYLSEVSGHDWSIESIYINLDHLVLKGYVRFKDDPTPQTVFKLTAEGVAALTRIKRVQDALWEGLPPVAFEQA